MKWYKDTFSENPLILSKVTIRDRNNMMIYDRIFPYIIRKIS